jgi:hypothetical protein
MFTATETSSALVYRWKNLRKGSARASRVGFGVTPKQSFIPRDLIFNDAPRPRGAFASTREARALPFWREFGGGDHAGRNEA